MINKLLYKLTAGRPCRLIDTESGPYLERYFLAECCGVTFYLHRFVSSDPERHLHNHPWGWGRSLILAGGYDEDSVLDICPAADEGVLLARRKIRWWNKVNGSHFHRISNAEPGTWTLFFHGPRTDVNGNPISGKGAVQPKGWGFLEAAEPGITVYTAVTMPPRRWWLDNPKIIGRRSGRVPLSSS